MARTLHPWNPWAVSPHFMERAKKVKINNSIVFIHNNFVHTAANDHHMDVLNSKLQQLEKHKLKINFAKCFFGSMEVAYLCFVLTPEGICRGRKTGNSLPDASTENHNGSESFNRNLQLFPESHQVFLTHLPTSPCFNSVGSLIFEWAYP